MMATAYAEFVTPDLPFDAAPEPPAGPLPWAGLGVTNSVVLNCLNAHGVTTAGQLADGLNREYRPFALSEFQADDLRELLGLPAWESVPPGDGTGADAEPPLLPVPDESPTHATAVTDVFCDGGVCVKNPSPHGGTWAWCHVTAAGEVAASASGTVTPAECGTPAVSNNQTEFLAALLALEALPAGWSGRVLSDSGVTIARFQGARTRGLSDAWVSRMDAALARLGTLEWVLLGGHPTRADLGKGFRSDGKPVSKWNVHCDRECGKRAKELIPQTVGADPCSS
jgi:ribonuclease HI